MQKSKHESIQKSMPEACVRSHLTQIDTADRLGAHTPEIGSMPAHAYKAIMYMPQHAHLAGNWRGRLLAVFIYRSHHWSPHRWDSNGWRTVFCANAPVDKQLHRRRKAETEAISIPMLHGQKSTQQLLVDSEA